MIWISAHYKALVVAVGAVLVLVVDSKTADEVVGALTIIGTVLVPNDPDAVDQVWHRRR